MVINLLQETGINKIIDSCLNKFEKIKTDLMVDYIPPKSLFSNYFNNTYEKYRIINTIIDKKEPLELKEVYIPLTITSEEEGIQYKITEYKQTTFNKFHKILITDTAGMGKSTLTKYLFLNIIDCNLGIPIYIELRKLSKENTILNEIFNQFQNLNKNEFNPEILLKLIQTGDFIFFLDGYDEIRLEDKTIITSDIQEFISKTQQNTFFLTSRPEPALTSFGDFKPFKISPLCKMEAFELLKKYDRNGVLATKLISEIKKTENNAINEFLGNPLLVSLLYTAYNFKNTLPLKKHIFYRQVFDAYFESHDLSKGDFFTHEKISKLGIDDFERILRFLGYICFKSNILEYEKTEILKLISKSQTYCSDLSFSPSAFLSDITINVPLFMQDGNYYRWAHKSIQEYFAALCIYHDSKENLNAILTQILNNNNLFHYLNLLDIYYDLDYWGFTENITLPILKSFVTFYDSNIYKSETIPTNLIKDRISFLFYIKEAIISLDKEFDSEDFKKSRFNFRVLDYEGTLNANIDIKNNLLNMILKKELNLKRTRKYNIEQKSFAKKYALQPINVHSGETDIIEYQYINSKLLHIKNYILDYNNIKNFISQIEEHKSNRISAESIFDKI